MTLLRSSKFFSRCNICYQVRRPLQKDITKCQKETHSDGSESKGSDVERRALQCDQSSDPRVEGRALRVIMRDIADSTGDVPKWIVLDGDIDSMWSESPNTVMDYNEVLTLASNEGIAMTATIATGLRDLTFEDCQTGHRLW